MNNNKKVVLFGLDGTPYTLIKKLALSGVMKNTAGIIKSGSLSQMDASIPEVSSVSWSCFMTGKNPARHGIFGFTDLKPGSYNMTFPNFHCLKSETIWDLLDKYDKKTVVINMPATYPAKKINGVLVSGFVAIDMEKAVYPANILRKLKEINYNLDVDLRLAGKSLDKLMDNIFETLNKRIKLLEYFWKFEEWDMFLGIITGTDRLHHFFWDACGDESSVYHEKFMEYYIRIDEMLGRFYNDLPDNSTFMMMSDHGFTGIDQEVYLSNVFMEMGILKFRSGQKDLNNIEPSTRAFIMDPGRVYVNLKGKYPGGSVDRGNQYEEVIQEVIEKISEFKINGKKPVSRILRKEDVYSGEFIDKSPDLILCPNYGYDLKATLFESSLYGRRIFKGMHTYDDAFFYVNKKLATDKKPDIVDPAATILSAFDLEIPPDMDGISLI